MVEKLLQREPQTQTKKTEVSPCLPSLLLSLSPPHSPTLLLPLLLPFAQTRPQNSKHKLTSVANPLLPTPQAFLAIPAYLPLPPSPLFPIFPPPLNFPTISLHTSTSSLPAALAILAQAQCSRMGVGSRERWLAIRRERRWRFREVRRVRRWVGGRRVYL